ncbi:hypothetical protein GDO81_020555 [Engystomops pustulosus]|uniref:Uncharacterized protein n=1 Tax=Engystomops pustulosus TaxID=76066 RepID=A0AAV6YQL0_ENGPU|nr:hypothetical protein GDO81_020555 [Engystomops pustulosus]
MSHCTTALNPCHRAPPHCIHVTLHPYSTLHPCHPAPHITYMSHCTSHYIHITLHPRITSMSPYTSSPHRSHMVDDIIKCPLTSTTFFFSPCQRGPHR